MLIREFSGRENRSLSNLKKMRAEAMPVWGFGKLKQMCWALGLTVASSKSAKLNTPFVRVTFTVEEAGIEEQRTVNMTILEFQEFRATMKDILMAIRSF